ncbi:Lpg1974 family pore-forming outer membrane protein [Legionella sp. km772]|uniref:Lpg1974 family pore-forming outer membrane protein n=1 Tax=Legionella sp. km772 TaxID=2498111 RepID=UPI000F8D9C5F|nr:Lpg1974 family pore-forming outer membrane protein [Legionella sp. km772]RUR12094.1 hypothetical protein ELY15_06255 [Legionella sp. km772]
MLKKTFLAVLGLTANGLALAGTMGPVCAPGNVTVPCEAKLWSFGVDALYLNMNNGDFRGYESSAPLFNRIDDEWTWGFRAEAAYQYSTGNDAAISWIHLTNLNHQFLPVPATGIPSEQLDNESRFDQVHAVLGQHVSASATNKIRFYGGLSYAQIENNRTFYNVAFALLPGLSNRTDNSYFNGVGPVLGIDYSYYVSNDLSLVANGATSLLYGSTHASAWTSPYAFIPVNLNTQYASKKTVVPGFEAKLGVNYAYGMANGTLNLEGGYQAIQYIAPLQAFPSSTSIRTSDFGVYGPYFGLKYVGNA